MKKNIILFLFIVFIRSSLLAQSTKITDQTIGDIRLKQSINKLKIHKGWTLKHNSKMINGGKETIYTVWEDGKMIVEINPKLNRKTMKYTDKIDKITTYSTKYKTSKGLMVGSTLESVLNKYPNGSIVKSSEGKLLVQSSEEYILYIIDPKSYIGPKDKLKHHESTYFINDFSKDAKIIAINIFNVEEETNM